MIFILVLSVLEGERLLPRRAAKWSMLWLVFPGAEYIDISVINYSVTEDTPHTSITILANTSQNYPLHVQDEVQGS